MLLYAYPWMPYPRRVIIYLREKGIPPSLVTIVRDSDPQLGNVVPPEYPPKPPGSLPILAVPSADESRYTYIGQSLAIINYLEDLCDARHDGFPRTPSMRGTGADLIVRARQNELLALADQLTADWNPVRTFGSGAGTMSVSAASKEMLRWIHRALATIEGWWQDQGCNFSDLLRGDVGVTLADILLYQFLEFTKDCYGRDMSQGSGETVKDVYGRDVVEKYTKLREFYDAFKTRDSARRNEAAGEVASKQVLKRMQTWVEGSF